VFSLTKKGAETAIHEFGNGTDGEFPSAALIAVDGTFYETTQNSGAYDMGSVFSVTPSAVETVLYSFAGGSDGAYPVSSLLSYGGALYGTTGNGGGSKKCQNGCGTIFKTTP
jgi:uncharacterized repeat protein (TIGR03803 family)